MCLCVSAVRGTKAVSRRDMLASSLSECVVFVANNTFFLLHNYEFMMMSRQTKQGPRFLLAALGVAPPAAEAEDLCFHAASPPVAVGRGVMAEPVTDGPLIGAPEAAC